jgi:signal transduction histidine kinase
LQASRERLVTAREEERRRLRRDLHDGLGPALAIQSLKVGAARSLLGRQLPGLDGTAAHDVLGADAMLAELEQEIAATLADVRRLVYDLRPPTLDELGLVAAIREAAARYMRAAPASGPQPDGLTIHVEAPEVLPPLPAAVEVAAFRITQEALTNVVHHARAHTCRISLRLEDDLWLEVEDDGQGLPLEPGRTGLGLASMRERAAELGGACQIEAGPGGGTRVTAHLPLAG